MEEGREEGSAVRATFPSGEDDDGTMTDFAATYAQLCADERTIPLEGLGREVVVRQDTGGGQGGAVWGSALALAAFVDAERTRCTPWWQRLTRHRASGSTAEPISVVELGAGTGASGMAVAALIGNARAVLTDMPAYLPLLRHNADLNASLFEERGCTVDVVPYVWGDNPPVSRPNGREAMHYDLVVGSDLVYDASKKGFEWSSNIEALVRSLGILAHPNYAPRSTTAIMAVERRRDSAYYHDAFVAHLVEAGWGCDVQTFSIPGCTDTLIMTLHRESSPSGPRPRSGKPS